MTCSEVHDALEPFVDGELDNLHSVQVEEHLSRCESCREQLQQLQSLRKTLEAPELYYRAPAACRAKVEKVIRADSPARPLRWRPIAAALVAFGALAAGVMLLVYPTFSATDRLSEWVVASHVRSQQAEHLIDVPSSDIHTVKPWFRGKLDFSPRVPDLADQGYTLLGGRLDYLADRPAAAIVYRRGPHVINVFTWPAAEGQDASVRRLFRNGFDIRQWQHAGMNYWVVSDISADKLDEFVKLFQAPRANAEDR